MMMTLRTGILATLLLANSVMTAADEPYYTGNPGSAYPPGCINGPLRELDLTGENVVSFFSDRVWLETAHKIESTNPTDNLGEVQLDMYRVGCAEPNRSVIIAEFRLTPEWVDPRKAALLLPWLGGNTGFDPYPFEFKPEPNSSGLYRGQSHFTKMSFGEYTGGWDDPRWFNWRYVLDVPYVGDRDDPPQYYNGNFALLFYRSDGAHFLTVDVPTTRVVPAATRLPLNGRLSGHWVEQNAADQGLLLSFSIAPPPPGSAVPPPMESDLVVFLSWFTFGQRGDLLWLTGAARFAQGSSEVVVELERVDQGAFLGDAPARRATVGSARIRAIQCNRLEVDYDLLELGLGNDTMQLERLLALEIADYPCRDYEALQRSAFPADTN